MALQLDNSDVSLSNRIKKWVKNNTYPSVLELNDSISDLPGGIISANSAKAYRANVLKTDQQLPVPEGYPVDLPRPYVTEDNRVVLKPVPWVRVPDAKEVGYIMIALQDAINRYAPKPYPVNWEVDNYGSGYGRIEMALRPTQSASDLLLWKFTDFLKYPIPTPDPLKSVFMGVMNTLIPGSSILIGALDKGFTALGPKTETGKEAVFETNQTSETILNSVSKIESSVWIIVIVIIVVIIILISK